IYARLTEDATGCFNITAINLIVDQCEIIIPQAFSPNGDGFNETFEIIGLRDQFPNFRLQVFNRHGMEVYDGNISVPDWDGTSRFGSQSSSGRLPVGTYFYLLRFNDGVTEPRASFVYLNY
ncbi:MAG: gliding motility-associated C-terminal domain-containing protein, partial [Flavobacteriaceae bacterium]|nr:gliding motility-associated C-terminal domain-containing protein [Flavobacteriaceae bacterium]